MLVLTRRVGEEVVLPDVRVRFTVLSVSGGRIRVGVVAPTAVAVLRGELAADAAGGGPAAGGGEDPQNDRRGGKGRSEGRV
jgi:carbon storage regulator CsrA